MILVYPFPCFPLTLIFPLLVLLTPNFSNKVVNAWLGISGIPQSFWIWLIISLVNYLSLALSVFLKCLITTLSRVMGTSSTSSWLE